MIKAETLLKDGRNALEEDVKRVIATLLDAEMSDCDASCDQVPSEKRR